MLTGPGETQSFAIEYNGTPVTRAVNEGRWTVTVSAYLDDLDGELYATGSRGVDVIAGQDNGVTVNMTPAFDLPACEHEWGQWEIITHATAATIGVETGTCAKCGDTSTRRFASIAAPPTGLSFAPIAGGTYSASGTADAMGHVEIPGWVHDANGDAMQVTAIANNAFITNTNISSVTISEGVTSIGSSAFSDCAGLESVEIPSSAASIGSRAFAGCVGLVSVEIPEGVASIGNQAFDSCFSLESITIPASLISIGTDAFKDCTDLASVTIRDGEVSIAAGAFEGCTSLESVTFEGDGTVIQFDESFPEGASLRSAYQSGGAGEYVLTGSTWAKQ